MPSGSGTKRDLLLRIILILIIIRSEMASKTVIFASAPQPRRAAPGPEGRRQLQQHTSSSSSSKPKPAYSVATTRPTRPATVPEVMKPEDLVHPVQQQPLDEPLCWPELEHPPPHPEPTQHEGGSPTPHNLAASQVRNPLRLPAHSRLAQGSAATAGQRALQRGMTPAQQYRSLRHPPVAPEDPAELLKVCVWGLKPVVRKQPQCSAGRRKQHSSSALTH